MKATTIIFIILVFLIAFKYTKVFNVSWLIIICIFLLWFIIIYVKIHMKNKDRRTPRPVVVVNQQ